MAIKYRETVKCVCDKIVKFDDVIVASKFLDKWDLRTKSELSYCRGCELGNLVARSWLHQKFTEEEEDEDEEMKNDVIWRGESRNFCTCCGAIFSSEAVLRRPSRSDDTWLLGAPKSLGDYWVILSTQKNLPVRGEVFVKEGKEFIKIGDLEIILGEMASSIMYHRTVVLPEPPGTPKEES